MLKKREDESAKLNKESPYCAFKNDRYRLYALISRHIMTVGVITVLAFGPSTLKLSQLLALIGR